MVEGAEFKIDRMELLRLQKEADSILALSAKAKKTAGGKSD
jgi:hypothetical protein